LSGLMLDDDGLILGFTSKEGEEVKLKKEISLVKTPRINDWLTALETNMKLTLAELFCEAYEEYKAIIGKETIDRDAFREYIGKYPAQISVLGTQSVWTTLVNESLEAGGSTLPRLYDTMVKVLEF